MSFESVAYTPMLLGATGNVGGRILHLLVQNPVQEGGCRHEAQRRGARELQGAAGGREEADDLAHVLPREADVR